MVFSMTYAGSEVLSRKGLEGLAVEAGLYNDQQSGGDDVQPSDDLTAITTEPADYQRIQYSITSDQIVQHPSGWFGIDITRTFDTSSANTTGIVDGVFITDQDDTSDLLIATGELQRDKSNYLDLLFVDTVEVDSIVSIEGSAADSQ